MGKRVYKVTLRDLLLWTITVEVNADNRNDAVTKAWELYERGEGDSDTDMYKALKAIVRIKK